MTKERLEQCEYLVGSPFATRAEWATAIDELTAEVRRLRTILSSPKLLAESVASLPTQDERMEAVSLVRPCGCLASSKNCWCDYSSPSYD